MIKIKTINNYNIFADTINKILVVKNKNNSNEYIFNGDKWEKNINPCNTIKNWCEEIGIDYITIAATLPLNNFGGLTISRIINDIDDYVIIVETYGDDFIKRRGKYKIYYNNTNNEYNEYIKINNIRFNLSEFMNV